MKVSFDLFAKISVKGEDQAPLYRFLTNYPDDAFAGPVRWNFRKYLIGRDGKVIAKFGTRTLPTDRRLIRQIEEAPAAGTEERAGSR